MSKKIETVFEPGKDRSKVGNYSPSGGHEFLSSTKGFSSVMKGGEHWGMPSTRSIFWPFPNAIVIGYIDLIP